MKGVTATEALPAGVRLSRDLLARLRIARAKVFPNGQADIERDGRLMFVNLRGRVPLGECERFVVWAKPLAAITYDPTGDVLRDAVGNWLAGHFTEWWCAAYAFVAVFKLGQMLEQTESPIVLEGGDGMSAESPILVRAPSTRHALSAVYSFLGRELGQAGTWRIARRISLTSRDGSREQFDVEMGSGSARSLHFWLVRADALPSGNLIGH